MPEITEAMVTPGLLAFAGHSQPAVWPQPVVGVLSLEAGLPLPACLGLGLAIRVRNAGGARNESGRMGVTMAGANERRFEQLALAQMDFVWRCLRRLGVQEADADDAVQQVLLVAHAKLESIPEGRERAFLFATAARIAANARRSVRRREFAMEQASVRPKDPQINQELLSEQLQARALLDEVMAELPEDLKQVFILFEIEEMAIKEIADTLELPIGTVGSKLRRARKHFSEAVKRLKAKQEFSTGGRP